MKTAEEIAENARNRYKKQNEAAKNNWDTIGVKLPKGTKDRIKKLNISVNGFVNMAVLEKLEQLEQ